MGCGMEIMPVAKSREPRYPTASCLELHPELLRRVPERWRGNPVVMMALASACALLAERDGYAQSRNPGSGSGTKTATNVVATVADGVTNTASIFRHGDGHGSFGCLAVAAPVFLSEEEARQVIVEEAKKAGLMFQADAKRLTGLPLPVTDQYDFLNDESPRVTKKPKPPRTVTGTLVLDGTDAKRSVSYEYVSEEDFGKWERDHGGLSGSASHYDLLRTAETLRAGLAQAAPKERVGVFYDPMAVMQRPAGTKWTAADWKKAEQQAVGKSKEQLRLQVRDFIQWLKAQGVI